MDTVKLMLNSIASVEGAKFMTIDIVDMYLMSTLDEPEYMRIKRTQVPDELMDSLDLWQYLDGDSIMVRVDGAMYGLPQAGRVAHRDLVSRLASAGYHKNEFIPCLFTHADGTQFTLVVDDFGVKYTDKAQAQRLTDALTSAGYEVTTQWAPKKYLGISITFSQDGREVALSLPGYVEKMLKRFPQYGDRQARSPGVYTAPVYGQPTQYATNDTTGPLLTPAELTNAQAFIGSARYYAATVDLTVLTAINEAAGDLGRPAAIVHGKLSRIAAYLRAFPNRELVFKASDMVLSSQSDASYLSRLKARSVNGGIHYLGWRHDLTVPNGAVAAYSNVLDCVVSSVIEAEYGGVFNAGRRNVYLRLILEALGHPQLEPTTIFCDNMCAVSIAHGTCKLRKTKTVDMRYHWVRDRVRQGQLKVVWIEGANNLADFFTKPLPVHRHVALAPLLVRTPAAAASHFTSSSLRRANLHRLQRLEGVC
jgi:hypothetical protein